MVVERVTRYIEDLSKAYKPYDTLNMYPRPYTIVEYVDEPFEQKRLKEKDIMALVGIPTQPTRTHMMRTEQHAILADGKIIRCVNNSYICKDYTPDDLPLDEIAKELLEMGIVSAWIMPSMGISDDVKQMTYDPDEWKFFRKRDDKFKAITVSAKLNSGPEHKRYISISFVQNTKWASWALQAKPTEVLGAILYLEKELEVPVSGSPSTVGWNLFEKLHPEWIHDAPQIDLAKNHFTPHAARDLIWQRDNFDDIEGGYIHKFDKSMAYPYAASCLDPFYGTGTPEYFEGDCYDPKKIGVYRCYVTGDNPYPELPDIKYGEWIAGPIVRLLKKIGYSVEVLEGWVFPTEHQLLKMWGNKMWNARQSFRDTHKWKSAASRRCAELAVKQIAVATIGITAFRKFSDEQEEKKRPDIRLQTVARNAELMYHNMLAERNKTGHSPLLVYMDAVYYWSANPDGRAAYPEIVKREGQFGGFKYEGSMKVTPEVKAILARGAAAGVTLTALNQIGWN